LALCAIKRTLKQECRERYFLLKAKARFEDLLGRHELGFADHAVEFYLGTNQEIERAFELANKNMRNRPTLAAYEAAYAAAIAASKHDQAQALAAESHDLWGSISAYKHSVLMSESGQD